MEVEMELSRIVISEFGGEQYIFLREKAGQRTFPIVIGIAEALAIDRRLKGHKTLRPMTHDLMSSVIERLGGQVRRIVINDLRQLTPDEPGQTFIATIHLQQDGHDIEIDSRPSDAIALGVATSVPIFVAEHVLEAVLKEPASMEDKIALLRRRLETLADRIAELSERLEDQEFVSQAPEEVLEHVRQELSERQTEYDAIEEVLKKL